MYRLRQLIEAQTFGVCAYLGEKLGIASGRIRMSFIYATFLTFGSPVVLYLALAFWLGVRKRLGRDENPVWDI